MLASVPHGQRADKTVVIVQSNYIPWKGYFDLIAAADELIIYDDVQFTKNDWRNRNQIKTARGLEWLSIPVGAKIHRLICDVELPEGTWRESHLAKLRENYQDAPYFNEIMDLLKSFYTLPTNYKTLSAFNRALIEAICTYLGIQTKISYSWDYAQAEGKTERLVDLCRQAGASEYISGPAAKSYLDEQKFKEQEIVVKWFDYAGYPEYKQLWGDFTHGVTVLDLLFNCGKNAPEFMKFAKRT